MKIISPLLMHLLVGVLLCFGLNSYAQNKKSKMDTFINPLPQKKQVNKKKVVSNSAVASLSAKSSGIINDKTFHQLPKNQKISLEELHAKFGLSKKISLKTLGAKKDNLGFENESFQQFYNNIPVDGYMLYKHSKDKTTLHGSVAEINNFDTKPTLNEVEAKQIAQSFLSVSSVIQEYPVTLKIIKSVTNRDQFDLAYEVRIDAVKPLVMKKVFVDAKTGEILNTIQLLPHADVSGTAATYYSGTQNVTLDKTNNVFSLKEAGRKIETYDATTAEFTDEGYVGFSELTNPSATWTASAYMTSFTIKEAAKSWWYNSVVDSKADFYIIIKDKNNKKVYESGYVNNKDAPVTFKLNFILNNGPYKVEVWDYDTSDADDFGGSYTINTTVGTNNYSDTNVSGSYTIVQANNPALDVHWGMEVTYDFYKNVLGRNSYDDKGGLIRQFLNPTELQLDYGNSPNNAFAISAPYNVMVYGLGDGEFLGPVVGLDVEGHEFTHLVVGNNGNGGLDYQGESGALNESFADIFGVSVEFYSAFKPDWTMGEDIMISDPFLRSLSDPKAADQPDTYGGSGWVNPGNLSNDYGGVHTNSGVQNYWFYLLSVGGSGTNDLGNDYDVAGIGLEKAQKIAYRNLMTYLGPKATYYDAYLGALQAADDIYGNPSIEYEEVRKAWFAVGVGNTSDAQCATITITESSGQITDGSGSSTYSDNLNCSWLIQPAGADQIVIDFTNFDTEKDVDIVRIYDGPSDEYEILMEWSGNTLPSKITSTVGSVYIVFISDADINMAGWSLNYSIIGSDPVCEGYSLLKETAGSFSDGSGTATYGNNHECYWYIAPPCATSIMLSFSSFDIELDYDGLIIYDGLEEDAQELAVLSGNDIPENITSTTGEMLLVFVSDFSGVFNGFEANYTSTGAAFCSGTNILSVDDYGVINDGSGADEYCSNQECSWLISPPDAETITLYFSSFDLEQPSPDGNIYDAIEVYDGDSEDAKLIGVYTGSNIPPAISSTGSSIYLKFYSDINVAGGGWELEYVTATKTYCTGDQVLTALSGSFGDGSDDEDYGNNSTCSWLIQPSNAGKITLSFTAFDLEEDYDAVIVYDGVDANAPELKTLTGNSLPANITTQNGSLYVEFLSDPAIRKSGWSATYSSENGILGLSDQMLQKISIYPNPASGSLTINNLQQDNIHVSIYNLLGQELIKPINLKEGINTINISALFSGCYFADFVIDGKHHSQKVMIK